MSTISPVGSRPPSFVRPSAHHSLKRTASAIDDSGTDTATSDVTASEVKRQKYGNVLHIDLPSLTSPVEAARAEYNIGAQSSNARVQPTKIVDGFFVGSEGIPSSGSAAPPPFPQRPWNKTVVSRTRSDILVNNTGVRKRIDLQVQNVPYTADTPAKAPRLAPDRFASFCPWKGNHPEDVMTEQVVKHGFNDKSLFANETSSVRQSPSLFNAINKAGLRSLSSCLSALVEERRAVRKISTDSTFKPPPRATLTETKRKAWLNDLSDPTVPLRKLIRTIPQGIRGQSLLEQCRGSNIPIGRAVWFAKCVGANEIRFLKRKGPSTFSAGGEGKWLREWTINVEQFLESALAQSEREGWRSNVQYSLNLATRLYSDALLDHDHFLEWLARSTIASSLEQLPTWLLLVEQHTTDLFKHRKRATPLTQNLVERFAKISKLRSESLRPLTERLSRLIRSIVHLQPSNFLLPRFWSKYRDSLEACLDHHNEADSRIIEQLAVRNEQLNSPFNDSNRTNQERKAVLSLLDHASAPFDVSTLSDDCLSACNQVDMLIQLILEWSTTRYRSDECRPYLAVSLLNTLHAKTDIAAAVNSFLLSVHRTKDLDVATLQRFIPEAIQLQVFFPSRFMQSLTAQGGLSPPQNKSSNDEGRFDHSQVLKAIPSCLVSPAVWNLRNAILRRVGYSPDAEAEENKSYWDYIMSSLPRIFSDHKSESVTNPGCSSPSSTFNVAESLRVRLSQLVSTTKKRRNDKPLLSDSEFCIVRRIMEQGGHVRALAEIVELCTGSNDHHIFASLVDTVNVHLALFSATGHLNSLHTALFQAYTSFGSPDQRPLRLIFSLLSLGSRTSTQTAALDLLQKDLTRGIQGSALAACSPVSDFVAESLQQAGQTFVEEFEAVLSTGNTMEEQTMAQLFQVMSDRLEKSQHQAPEENDEVLCGLHTRLRTFGMPQFDTLMATWMRKLVTLSGSRIDELLPILIASQCLSFSTCMEILVEETTNSTQWFLSQPLQHLAAFMDTVEASKDRTDFTSNRLWVDYALYIQAFASQALQAWCMIAEHRGPDPQVIPKEVFFAVVLSGEDLSELQSSTRKHLSQLLDSLFSLPAHDNLAASIVLLGANPACQPLPFKIARLRLWAMDDNFAETVESDQLIVRLFDLARNALDEPWEDFVVACGGNVAARIREKAEEAFFLVPTGATGRILFPRSPALPIASAKVYAEMIGRLASSIPSAGVPKIASLVVEKFSTVMRLLNTVQALGSQMEASQRVSEAAPVQAEEGQIDVEQLNDYLTLLLNITIAHQNTFVTRTTEPLPSPTMPPKLQQEVVKLLALLVTVGIHPALQNYPETSRRAFDVAAMVVDDKPDELRSFCVRILKDKIRDPRVEYLFGSASSGRSITTTDYAISSIATSPLNLLKDGKVVGEFKARSWEMLEGGVDASINLALFEARNAS